MTDAMRLILAGFFLGSILTTYVWAHAHAHGLGVGLRMAASIFRRRARELREVPERAGEALRCADEIEAFARARLEPPGEGRME